MLWVNTSLEIQVMLLCSWNCHACDQFSNLPAIHWVRKATMSMEQIQRFVNEMTENNAYLGRIRLVGGEPTLHPKLPEIVDLLRTLVDQGHVLNLEIVTNGASMEKLTPDLRKKLKIRISNETEKSKTHTANLANTPATLGYADKVVPCNAPGHCGISLNYFGYFPCSSGAGLARLMNDVPRWQRLELPKKRPLEEWSDLKDLCGWCFHALRSEDKVKCGTRNYELNVPHPKMFVELAPWLNGKKTPSEWGIYGGGSDESLLS